jgi:hypothetical protein
MTGDALSKEHREIAVPAREECIEFGALPSPFTGHTECPKAALGSVTHSMDQPVALLSGDTECIGKIGPRQSLPHAQFKNELVACIEAPRRSSHELSYVGEVDLVVDDIGLGLRGWEHHVTLGGREVGDHGTSATSGAPVHLVAQDGEEPGLEASRISELPESFCC